MNEKNIETIFLSLAYAAWADGIIRDEEKELFHKSLQLFQEKMTQESYSALSILMDSQPNWEKVKEGIEKLSEPDKMELVKRIYEMFHADREYAEAEEKVMKQMLEIVSRNKDKRDQILIWLELNRKCNDLALEISNMK